MHNKLKILVVDDDADDVELFCEALHDVNSSAECIAAVNGEEALSILHTRLSQLPDFIFLDLNMPRMDGITCLSELKKDTKLKDIPVIILSTSSDPRDMSETYALGAVSFITKPAEFTELRKIISRVTVGGSNINGN